MNKKVEDWVIEAIDGARSAIGAMGNGGGAADIGFLFD